MELARSFASVASLGLVAVVLLSACGEDLPSFPATPRDLGIECTSTAPAGDSGATPGTSSGCASSEVCLQGRCYAGCSDDDDCASSEQCTRGVCASRSTPRPDLGMPDAGTPDPCAAVTCSDTALPYCYPRTGGCVQCRTSDDCGAVAPVCDVAFGVCRTFVPAQCAPCKLDADCTGAVGTFATRCLQRDTPHERVCVAQCASDGSCPQGTACNIDTNNCLPRLTTCTTFFAASQMRACTADAECAPLGSTPDDFLFPGSCRASACAAPCGTAVECYSALQTCDGTFCVP